MERYSAIKERHKAIREKLYGSMERHLAIEERHKAIRERLSSFIKHHCTIDQHTGSAISCCSCVRR